MYKNECTHSAEPLPQVHVIGKQEWKKIIADYT